ncbi:MAG: hypothetical protein AAF694_06965, partial [Bacteroidota bacterium]
MFVGRGAPQRWHCLALVVDSAFKPFHSFLVVSALVVIFLKGFVIRIIIFAHDCLYALYATS